MDNNKKHTIKAPAKLNLYLKVVGKRPDGYHNIVSLMVPVDLFDTIEVEKLDKDREIDLICTGRPVPHGEENLVYKATKCFMKNDFPFIKNASFNNKKTLESISEEFELEPDETAFLKKNPT